jgi:hypothetical protein
MAGMQTGIDFLKSQLDEAISYHAALLQSMADHEGEADDTRYRDLCELHLPRMRQHQMMMQEFQAILGAPAAPANPGEVAGAIRRTAGSVLGFAKGLADAPQSDFQRLSADIDLARKLEVIFRTFRDAGRELRIDRLARIGEMAERHHDEYSADAKRLLVQLFVERAQGAREIVSGLSDNRADFRMG